MTAPLDWKVSQDLQEAWGCRGWMAGQECKGKVVRWVHKVKVERKETQEIQEQATQVLQVKQACQELVEEMVKRVKLVTEGNLVLLGSPDGLDQKELLAQLDLRV